jgi:hypothetical protein
MSASRGAGLISIPIDQLKLEIIMSAFLSRPRVAATLVLAALATMAERRAEAQVGFGFGLGGDPFAFFVPQTVPSPTDYLFNLDLARIAADNAHRLNAAQVAHTNANAYWNRLRDNSGANSYDLASRQSVGQRVGATSRSRPTAAPAPAPTPTPAPATVPPRPRVHSLEDFFLGGAHFDWPRDAPNDGPERSDREAAEQALRTVFEQVRAGGKATAQSVATARAKLITYGQKSLSRVEAERSRVVSNVFHYFLLFLNDTLLELGGDGSQ